MAQKALLLLRKAFFLPPRAFFLPQRAFFLPQRAFFLLQKAFFLPQKALLLPQKAFLLPRKELFLAGKAFFKRQKEPIPLYSNGVRLPPETVVHDKLLNMLTTYEAVLRGNLLEWRRDSPPHPAPGKAANVYVTVLDEPASSGPNQGQRMAAELEKLARSQAVAGVDAGQWEREVRTERPLPGRGE